MKRLIVGIIILLVLIAGGFTAAIMTLNSIDWSEYQEPIADAVRDATGRELHFSGALNVHIGLSPGIVTDGITLQNADWAESDQMLMLDHAEVRLKLLPLVFGRIELHRLEITGLDLQLESDRQGRGNWEFETAGAETTGETDSQLDSGDEFLPKSTFLRNALIREAVIVYHDGQTGESHRLGVDQLAAQMDSASAPLKIDLTGSYDKIPIELSGKIDGVGGLLAGNPLGLDVSVRLPGAEVNLEGSVLKPLEAQGIKVSVHASGDSPAELSALAGTELPDLGAWKVGTDVAGMNGQFELTSLSIDIADMHIGGDLKADVSGDPLRLEANLSSPIIDLTRLMPAEESSPDEEGAPSQTSGESNERIFPDDPLPLDAFDSLDAIDAIVNLKIDELIVDPETILTNLDIGLRAGAGKVSIDPLNFNAMGAILNGNVELDAVQEGVAVVAKLEVNHPSVGDLVEDDDKTMLEGGPLDLDLDVTGSGASIRQIMASLNGSATVELGAAQASSSWLQRIFAEITAILTKTAPRLGASEPIDLYCVVTDFSIRDGVAEADSFVVDARKIALFGKGNIDLRDETLHLGFEWLADRAKTQDVLPPFKVRGTLASPTSRFDTKAMLGTALGLNDGSAASNSFEPPELTAESGPKRCRQRQVAYDRIRQEQARPEKNSPEKVLEDIESAKDALKNLGGFFKKKKD